MSYAFRSLSEIFVLDVKSSIQPTLEKLKSFWVSHCRKQEKGDNDFRFQKNRSRKTSRTSGT
jgi:hypothetical protein